MLKQVNLPEGAQVQFLTAIFEEFGLAILQQMEPEKLKQFLSKAGMKPGHAARIRRELEKDARKKGDGEKGEEDEKEKKEKGSEFPWIKPPKDVEYEDEDGDVIKFCIEEGRLIKYVNGLRKVGENDTSGVVTKLYYSPPRLIEDQCYWGGNAPVSVFNDLAALADFARVRHYLPPSYVEFYDSDDDLIKYAVENNNIVKYVNGQKRVGDGKDTTGIVTKFYVYNSKYDGYKRVEDQQHWGGDMSCNDLRDLYSMTQLYQIPVHGYNIDNPDENSLYEGSEVDSEESSEEDDN